MDAYEVIHLMRRKLAEAQVHLQVVQAEAQSVQAEVERFQTTVSVLEAELQSAPPPVKNTGIVVSLPVAGTAAMTPGNALVPAPRGAIKTTALGAVKEAAGRPVTISYLSTLLRSRFSDLGDTAKLRSAIGVALDRLAREGVVNKVGKATYAYRNGTMKAGVLDL